MARPKKTPAPAPAEELQTKAAPVKKPSTAKTPKAAHAEMVEELYLQLGGEEWNISECKKRVAADYAAAGHDASSVRKLSVYLKPEEGKAYYVVNGEETGSIDL